MKVSLRRNPESVGQRLNSSSQGLCLPLRLESGMFLRTLSAPHSAMTLGQSRRQRELSQPFLREVVWILAQHVPFTKTVDGYPGSISVAVRGPQTPAGD